ncbi:MAG: NAD-dependent epimerase/dehydratase family protein [Bacteroidota bacterium]|nr:NAD-dependent epimerase/dehydratase family protein [Bacteroidota bacterium]
MQTILGAGGAIGKELAKELYRFTDKVRLVSRTPETITDKDELMAVDITNAEQTERAVQGSDVVYLTAGLPYKLKVWQQQWPQVMRNVIYACTRHNARLVFFDNMYLYDKNSLHNITEDAPVNPPSKKGGVRARIAQMLFDKVNTGELTAMIVRSADFYGPGVTNSILIEMVYKNMKKGKKAMWFADADKVHSFTYVPDAAKATALLGNTPDAYNQVWHTPTDVQKITGRQWVELFAQEMNIKPRFTVLGKGMVQVLGLFIPVLRESVEMMYQYDRDYFFNSAKFTERFRFEPTPYQEGVREVVNNTF